MAPRDESVAILEQLDPVTLNEFRQAVENFQAHIGALGIPQDQIERFIADILRQTVRNELNRPPKG